KSVLTRGEQERWDREIRHRDRVAAELEQLEERNQRIQELRDKTARGETREYSGWNGPGQLEPYSRASINEAQAGALHALERAAGDLSPAAADRVDALVRSSGPSDNSYFARYVETHGRSEY